MNKYVLCLYCKKKIHIDDFGMIDKKGIYHHECAIKYLDEIDKAEKEKEEKNNDG